MRIVCANHSGYPLAAAGERPTDAQLDAALRDQETIGLDLITDGQPGRGDPVTPFLGRLDGVRSAGPTRLPHPLGYGPRLIIQARLRRHGELCVAAYRRAAARARVALKVVLPGPYTLAHTAEIATTAYRHADALAEDLSVILAQEVAALVGAGAPVVQIDEPLILQRPVDFRLIRDWLEPLHDAAGGRATIVISTYGTDAAALYAQLNSLPGDVIAVDCAGRPALVAAIAETGSGKPLALGIVDGMADPPAADLARVVDACLRRYIHAEVTLQPSHGLGGLAIDDARTALQRLIDVRRALSAP